MVSHCPFLPNSTFCDITLVAGNWPLWEYLYHKSQSVSQSKGFTPRKLVVIHLPADQCFCLVFSTRSQSLTLYDSASLLNILEEYHVHGYTHMIWIRTLTFYSYVLSTYCVISNKISLILLSVLVNYMTLQNMPEFYYILYAILILIKSCLNN